MNFLKIILRLVVGGLFWILIAFWGVFIYYTIVYLVEGGPERIVHWYAHVSGMQFHWDWSVSGASDGKPRDYRGTILS